MSLFNNLEIKKIQSLIVNNSEVKSQTRERIEQLINTIGCQLPESYIQILEKFGYLSIENADIYGINDVYKEYGGIYNGEKYTTSVNKCDVLSEFKSGLDFFKYDNKIVPIYPVGNGDYFAFNLHLYNSKTKEAPIWYLNHEGFVDDNFEEIVNPDYTLTTEDYHKRGWTFWLPTKYKSFKEFLMDTVNNNIDFTTY